MPIGNSHDAVRGILCVLGAWVAFGSFGVFISTFPTAACRGVVAMPTQCRASETPSVVAAKVDPLVFQTYKTTAVFLTSWLVLTYTDFDWTWWGVVDSLVWVPAGAGAVIAVRCAGLGIAQGVWSGLSGGRGRGSACFSAPHALCMHMCACLCVPTACRCHAAVSGSMFCVCVRVDNSPHVCVAVPVSFIWGAAVFGEDVKSWPLAIAAIAIIVIGTSGMTWATAPRPTSTSAGAPASLEAGSNAPAVDGTLGCVPVQLAVCAPPHLTLRTMVDKEESLLLHAAGQSGSSSADARGTGMLIGLSSRGKRVVGLCAAVMVALLSGTMYVPLHYAGDVRG